MWKLIINITYTNGTIAFMSFKNSFAFFKKELSVKYSIPKGVIIIFSISNTTVLPPHALFLTTPLTKPWFDKFSMI